MAPLPPSPSSPSGISRVEIHRERALLPDGTEVFEQVFQVTYLDSDGSVQKATVMHREPPPSHGPPFDGVFDAVRCEDCGGLVSRRSHTFVCPHCFATTCVRCQRHLLDDRTGQRLITCPKCAAKLAPSGCAAVHDLIELLASRLAAAGPLEPSPADAFRYPPPGALDASGVILAQLPTGEPFCHKVPLPNLLAIGPPGSGKTNWIRQIVRQVAVYGGICFLWDQKRELRCLLNDPVLLDSGIPVHVLAETDLRYAIFQGGDVPRPTIVNCETDIIGRQTGRFSAQRQLLIVAELLDGINGAGSGVSFPQAIEYLDRQRSRSPKESDNLRSISSSLDYMRRVFRGPASPHGVFDACFTDMISKMVDRPAGAVFVVESAGVAPEMQASVASLFLWRIYHMRSSPAVLASSRPVLLVLDDATGSLDVSLDRNAIAGVAPIPHLSCLGRQRLICIAACCHSASGVSRKFLDQAGVRALFRSSDPHAILQGLVAADSDAQVEAIKCLLPGQVVLFSPAVYPHAVLGTFPPHAPPIPSDADCVASGRRFLDTVTTVYPAPSGPRASVAPSPSAARPSAGPYGASLLLRSAADASLPPSPAGFPPVSGELIQFLLLADAYLPITAVPIYRHLHLDNRKGGILARRCELDGLIVRHALITHRRGGRPILFELTAKGREFLAARGLLREHKALTTGGFLHERVARAVAELSAGKGFSAKGEYTVGSTRFDLALFHGGSLRVLVQIAVSASTREIEAFLRSRDEPAVRASRLVLVALDSAMAKRIVDGVCERTDCVFAHSIQIRIAGAVIMDLNER